MDRWLGSCEDDEGELYGRDARLDVYVDEEDDMDRGIYYRRPSAISLHQRKTRHRQSVHTEGLGLLNRNERCISSSSSNVKGSEAVASNSSGFFIHSWYV